MALGEMAQGPGRAIGGGGFHRCGIQQTLRHRPQSDDYRAGVSRQLSASRAAPAICVTSFARPGSDGVRTVAPPAGRPGCRTRRDRLSHQLPRHGPDHRGPAICRRKRPRREDRVRTRAQNQGRGRRPASSKPALHQQRQDRLQVIVRQLLQFLIGAILHRMRNEYISRVGPETLRLRRSGIDKLGSGNADRRNSIGLEICQVMRTARRAGASVGQPFDHQRSLRPRSVAVTAAEPVWRPSASYSV